jgi:hypothetical protein
VHSEFPNADLQIVFANKVKRVQVWIDAGGHFFKHLSESAQRLSGRTSRYRGNSQVTKMMAEVSDVTWKNREEAQEACTLLETLLLLVIIGDNSRAIQTFVVFCN